MSHALAGLIEYRHACIDQYPKIVQAVEDIRNSPNRFHEDLEIALVCRYCTIQSVMEMCLTTKCRHPTQPNEDFEYVPLIKPLS